MGREDIDVRCLGRGRPFIIEMKNPKKRNIDMDVAMAAINDGANGAIEVDSMRSSQRTEVVRIKDTPAEKSYRIRFRMHSLDDNEDVDYKAMKKAELESLCVEKGLKKSGKKADLIERLEGKTTELPDAKTITKTLEGMEGCVLDQRTPKRVAHRRADKIRKRSVISVSEIAVEITDGVPEVEVNLRCESGTYVKETVHGDGGRTNPSVSGLLGARCEVIWLDVADIHAD
jgi:tRNA pseudouridine synthase 10